MKKQIKDVSQSTNIYEIAEAIQQLNLEAEIRTGNIEDDPKAFQRFFSSVPINQLLLPDGFYINGKTITNKGKIRNGLYCTLTVEKLDKINSKREPKNNKELSNTNNPIIRDISQSTNIYEIAEVIQQLNPEAEIKTGNIEDDPRAFQRFFSSVPVDQLLLPDGFYRNNDYRITNKDTTRKQPYCILTVEDLKMTKSPQKKLVK